MRLIPIGFSLGAFVLFGTSSRGEVRTFVAEGTVTRITDPLGTLNFTHVGAAFKYQFSFDSSAQDLNGTPSIGAYEGISSATMIGDILLPSGMPRIQIQDPNDVFSVSSNVTKPGFLNTSGAGLVLEDQVLSDALTSTALPSEPYPLDLFASSWLAGTFFHPNPGASSPYTLSIIADVDRFYAVPEPSSLLLIFELTYFLVRITIRRAT
jgi:hypothetical protein